MRFDLILRFTTKLLTPFLLVFGLYVHFHGDFGPGGGFQAGVILAAMVILYALLFGLNRAQHAVPQGLIEFLVPFGIFIYTATGVASMLLGGDFLDYNQFAHKPAEGQHLGILLIELGVVTTVFSTMVALFYAFAGRGRS